MSQLPLTRGPCRVGSIELLPMMAICVVVVWEQLLNDTTITKRSPLEQKYRRSLWSAPTPAELWGERCCEPNNTVLASKSLRTSLLVEGAVLVPKNRLKKWWRERFLCQRIA
ncbi:MAG: hypothetical protein NTW52_06280 [Planctomycetota bacterium]|nr:hypothetical protein [Planctomycetota bacterium]